MLWEFWLFFATVAMEKLFDLRPSKIIYQFSKRYLIFFALYVLLSTFWKFRITLISTSWSFKLHAFSNNCLKKIYVKSTLLFENTKSRSLFFGNGSLFSLYSHCDLGGVLITRVAWSAPQIISQGATRSPKIWLAGGMPYLHPPIMSKKANEFISVSLYF